MSPLPRRGWIGVSPQPKFGGFCLSLKRIKRLKTFIVRAINPSVASFYHFSISINTIAINMSHHASISIGIDYIHLRLLLKTDFSELLLAHLPKRHGFFGGINTA